MKRSHKILIAAFATPVVLVGAGVLVLWLMVNDVISTTERTQTFMPMRETTVEIYRTGRFEYYDCSFAVRRGRQNIIPKTRFDSARYITVNEHTPEMYTTYDVIAAAENDVVGIVRRERPYSLLAACDLAHRTCWQGGTWYHEQDRELGAKLLAVLQAANPKTEIALQDSDREAELYRQSLGIETKGQQSAAPLPSAPQTGPSEGAR
jgi:hypothetical protein